MRTIERSEDGVLPFRQPFREKADRNLYIHSSLDKLRYWFDIDTTVLGAWQRA